jgi:hypothetical protein
MMLAAHNDNLVNKVKGRGHLNLAINATRACAC